MKRFIAWQFAIISGLYLVISVPVPDPVPFIDEGIALAIFVKSMAYLGHDVRRFIPFLGKRKQAGRDGREAPASARTVDV